MKQVKIREPKYKVGDVVWLNEYDILTNKTKILAVFPSGHGYTYAVDEGGKYKPVYTEKKLFPLEEISE